jgi:predicted nucleotidyltransferase
MVMKTDERFDAMLVEQDPGRAGTKPTPFLDPVVRALSVGLRNRIGDKLVTLLLFGSRARGDAQADSDYDLLVIVDQIRPEIEDQILDLQVELLDRYDALVAVLLRTPEQWRLSQGFPLAENIAREGIPL